MPLKKTGAKRVALPPWFIAIVVALLAGGTVALTFDSSGTVSVTTSPPATSPPLLTKVDADADGKRDDALKVAPAAAADLTRALPKSELSEPLRGRDDVQDVGKVTGPLAADSMPGCRTRFVGNFSKRLYGDPSSVWMHQTVSPDRPGWGGQDALTAQAARRSSGTSWAVLIGGKDGLCTYTVPLKYSAWTQANANSVAIGIEIEAVGNEPEYCSTKCRATLMKVYREIRARYPAIKMRRGKITWGPGCRPIVVRTGIIEHSEGGSCAGGHADVTPWSITPLITYAAAYVDRASKAEREAAAKRGRTCNQLRWHRGKFRTQPRGGAGTATRKLWEQRRDRINALKRRAGTLGLNEARCRP